MVGLARFEIEGEVTGLGLHVGDRFLFAKGPFDWVIRGEPGGQVAKEDAHPVAFFEGGEVIRRELDEVVLADGEPGEQGFGARAA